MLEIIELLIHFVITFIKLLKPGGVKVVMTETIVMKQQLIVLNRHRKRAPPLATNDRFLFGLMAMFIGHAKDSLWSVDLFRCESATLKSHWVMVVIDQFTRRIIGFAVHAGDCDGVAYCRMFNQFAGGNSAPKHLSSDNDPLFLFHRWKANLRILEIGELKSVPGTPTSHPFIERVIGTTRRECLD